MENVAHTIAGLLIAEAVVAVRRRRGEVAPRFPLHAALTSAIANNVPDADLLYARITEGKLGYLLHHRGHTHTVIVGLALGLAVAGAVMAITRRRLGRGDAAFLLALGAAGPLVHLGMDAWNVYGVHPFWPFDNRWRYGDAVFIAEPLFWAAGLPPIALAGTSRWRRAIFFGALALGLALPWLTGGFVPLGARLALFGVAAAMTAACWRAPDGRRAALGLIAVGAVAALFFAMSGLARRQVAARLDPRATHDIAVSALPSNPWCFTVTTVEHSEAELVLRRATVAPLPSLVDVDSCPRDDAVPTAPLAPSAAPSDASLRWEGELHQPLDRLRELARSHCEVAALLRFARVPFFVERGGRLIAGDLRFDRDEALGFAELDLALVPASCPANVPPWTPPRAELLEH